MDKKYQCQFAESDHIKVFSNNLEDGNIWIRVVSMLPVQNDSLTETEGELSSEDQIDLACELLRHNGIEPPVIKRTTKEKK